MTSTDVTSRKAKSDDQKRSSAPVIVVATNEQQVTKVQSAFTLLFFKNIFFEFVDKKCY